MYYIYFSEFFVEVQAIWPHNQIFVRVRTPLAQRLWSLCIIGLEKSSNSSVTIHGNAADKFWCLDDMLEAEEGCDAAMTVTMRNAALAYFDQLRILIKTEGKIYTSCVRTCLA